MKTRRRLAVVAGLAVGLGCGGSEGLRANGDAGPNVVSPDAGSADGGLDAGRGAVDGGPDGGDAGHDAGDREDAGADAGHAVEDGGEDGGPDGASHGLDAGPNGGGLADAGLTRYPIILANGFGVSGGNGQTFGGVEAALQAEGQAVFTDDPPPFNSIAVRAASLLTTIQQVLAQTGATKVNLICHSMGGLDARYVVSSGGLGQSALVASITTLSTPHHGTALADFTLSLAPLGVVDPFVTAVESFLGTSSLTSPDVITALTDLSEAYLLGFNASTPDDPSVFYQSWAGVATIGGLPDPNVVPACQNRMLLGPNVFATLETDFVPLSLVVGHTSSDWVNDGVVAVESSIYGQFNGCVAADHEGMEGETLSGLLPVPVPATGFNYIQFYLDVAHGLAHTGF